MTRNTFGNSDHIASDDVCSPFTADNKPSDLNQLDSVLEYTRQVYEVEGMAGSSSHNRGRNEAPQHPGGSRNSAESDRKKQLIISRITKLEAEVEECRFDMIEIQKRMETRLQEKEMLERQLAQSVDPKGKGKAKEGINYMTEPFDWSEGLKARMKAVFGIESFRLCQEG